jgi:hypothetical protein
VSKLLAVAAILAAATAATARADLTLLPSGSSGDRVLVADVSQRLSGAQLVGAPPATQRIRVGLALAHPDPAGEDALLGALFDRSSPAYHQFLTPGPAA